MLTPYRNAADGSAEMRFNTVHSKARNIIERTIGILKARWRCLCSENKLRFSPERVATITNVCAALHNVCVDHKLPIDNTEVESIITRERGMRISYELSSSDSGSNLQRRAVLLRDRIRGSL